MENFKLKQCCPVKDYCGGCSFQEIEYAEQLKRKADAVKEALKANGIDEKLLSGIESSPCIYSYRNKMEYTFGDEVKDGPMQLGMHKKGNFMSVINAGQCQLVPDDFNTLLNGTLAFCIERGYRHYHKKRHDGLMRALILRRGVRTNELLVNIVTSSEEHFDEQAYTDFILESTLTNTVVGIIHTVCDSPADAVIPETVRVLYGRDYYNEEIMGLKFRVGAFSFFQTNVDAAERLYKEAISLIDNFEGKTVFDLYCGTGTITQALAIKAKEAIGVEIVEEAVKAAEANAKENNLANCRFIAGDVLKVIDEIEESPDVIVVDPPRSGIHPKALEKICGYNVPQIVYISCNPKTLAINLKAAVEYGYNPVFLKAFDNFSFTQHTEAICLLEKK